MVLSLHGAGHAWVVAPALFPPNGRSFIKQAYGKLSLRVGIPGSRGNGEVLFANPICLIFPNNLTPANETDLVSPKWLRTAETPTASSKHLALIRRGLAFQLTCLL